MAKSVHMHAENCRAFADLGSCTFADALIAIRRLSEEHGVRIDNVESTSGSRRSHWRPGDRTIRLNTGPVGLVSWITVIHEFAHALDGKLRPGHKRSHAPVFYELEADLCRIIHERGWHVSIPAERKAAEEEAAKRDADRAAARAVRDAIEKHPDNVRTKKIERRRAQIARLERKIKSLTTRLKSARRSLAALERAVERKAES